MYQSGNLNSKFIHDAGCTGGVETWLTVGTATMNKLTNQFLFSLLVLNLSQRISIVFIFAILLLCKMWRMVVLILISQWTTMRLLSLSFGRIWTITLSVTYLMITFYDSRLCFEYRYLAHVKILCALEVSLCQENLFFILKCCCLAACIIMCIVTDLYLDMVVIAVGFDYMIVAL